MSAKIQFEEVQPDPRRVIEGLRDTGYRFEMAVEDNVDNCIAANAKDVDVRIEMDYVGDITVSIADNGHGMDRNGLINAMRYGSSERPNPASLGKFGLGLKTAATAFCRKLSVISRGAGGATPLKATWDLEHVAEAGRWELLLTEPTADEIRRLDAVAGGGTGTLVLWEKVDRFMKNYATPGGKAARTALDVAVAELREHAAMVYQRFLDTRYTAAPNVAIRINGEKLKPWDPFCKGEASLIARNDSVEVDMPDGSKATFSIRAWLLPRGDDFKDQGVRNEARIRNDYQGLYIYRENRLIHGPDWLGMYRNEPHLSLLRVEFSFDHHLDQSFNVDIKKSKIMLDTELFTWLRDQFLPAPRRAAAQTYRNTMNKLVATAARGTHDSSNTMIAEKSKDLDMPKIDILDPDTNQVRVTTGKGMTTLRIRISEPTAPDQLHVQTTDSIDDGMLWEPCVIGIGNQGVSINTSHPYYRKVYLPNRLSGVTIQGLDSLLWALSKAEMSTPSETTRKVIEELRFEVSRILRKLVEDMPEPEIQDGQDS